MHGETPAPAVGLTAMRASPAHGFFRVLAAPHPFTGERVRGHVPCGTSVGEVVAQVQPNERLRRWALVAVNGRRIAALEWDSTFPAAGDRVAVLVLPPKGGDTMGWIAVSLQIAIGVALIATGNPMGAMLIVGGVAGGVSLAMAPKLPKMSKEPVPISGTLAVDGLQNKANLWGPIPRILGRHRAVPPYAAMPYTEVVGGDKYLRVILALSYGPVVMSDAKIGETALAEFTDIETEFRRGYLPSQITDRGSFDASPGSFPANPAFGDTWTVATGGTIDGVIYQVDDTITFNGLAAASSAAAWDKDQRKELSLYPGDVHQEDLNIELTKEDGWQTITSEVNADELSIDVTCPQGLLEIKKKDGDKRSFTVTIEIRYAPAGTENWVSLGVLSIRGRQQDPLYWGHRWKVDRSAAANGQFDVQVRRTSPKSYGSKSEYFSASYWTALRTFSIEDPIDYPGLAMLAMRVKPTRLAHGTLDEFSCVLTSIAKTWSGGTWSYQPTSNPAALYRAILQLAPAKTLADDNIDLSRLQEWSEFCDTKGFKFDSYVDYETSRREMLALIATAGRAYPIIRNGLKRSVAIDEPKTEVVQVFSPVNSWEFTGQILFPHTPHGYRVAFANGDKSYKPDERIVYADGYNNDNATDIEGTDFVGITDPDLIWKHGRFHWARLKRRRNVYSWYADIEALVCEPFDRVTLTHDTISVGLASGRIKDLVVDGDDITALVLDTEVAMQAGKTYAVQARNPARGAMTLTLQCTPGPTSTLCLSVPVAGASGPEAGDVVVFGEAGNVSIDLLIQSIEPQAQQVVKITAIPAAPEIHNADTGSLPAWSSTVKLTRLPAPVVQEMRSDADVMLIGPTGTLQTRVVFALKPVQMRNVADIRATVLQRTSGTDEKWTVATIQSQSPTLVAIIGVEDGETYDFTLQYTAADVQASPATAVSSYTVVGRTGAPPALTNLSIAAAGNTALVRWDPIDTLDVRFGGYVAFRHSPLASGATWANSTSLGFAAKGSDDHAWLPLKAGTYLARVFDASGIGAETVNTITSKQASILSYTPVTSLSEHPAFGGTHVNTQVNSGKLELQVVDTVDEVDDWDGIADFDNLGSSLSDTGTYRFAAGIDLGTVERVRVTSLVKATAVNLYDLIDDRTTPIDTWPDTDGTGGAPVDASVWAKFTDDDPAGTPAWTDFVRIDAQEVECRAIGRIECRLSTEDQTYQISVTELGLTVDRVT